MSNPANYLLGIDWGTSNRRAYVLDEQGKLLRQHSDGLGILNVGGNFETSLQELIQQLGTQPARVLMSGMVGSRNGWRQVPYLSTDFPLAQLPRSLTRIETGISGTTCSIVPGYQYLDAHGIPDVMRGEETQIFGAFELGATDGWFLLPGTHSKWVRVAQGKIEEIATFMTGELYALLSQHGTLAKLMTAPQDAPVAFEAGLKAAAYGGFTHTAFCCRALVVTDMMPEAHASSYLSGLLIGTEIHDILKRTDRRVEPPVEIIGSQSLASRYRHAMELLGLTSRVWEPDQVYIAALHALSGMKG